MSMFKDSDFITPESEMESAIERYISWARRAKKTDDEIATEIEDALNSAGAIMEVNPL